MQLKGKTVLVTGAAGFIGSHLVQELIQRDCAVRALVHYNSNNNWGNLDELEPSELRSLDVVRGDIADPFFVGRTVAGCDVVFHLAALIAIPYSFQSPHSYVSTNVGGTLNVLEACRAHGIRRLVHTSTSETYGTAQYVPIDERHPLQAQSPYAATKIAADKLVESYFRTYALPVATLRPFNTFGPRQSARAVIPTIISQAAVSTEVKLGALSPVRDLTFVRDTAAAFVAVAQCDDAVGLVLNSGHGQGISIAELADKILHCMGRHSDCAIVSDEERVRPDTAEVFQLVCDSTSLRKLTDWRPRTSLEDGLRQTIAYVRAHPQRFKADLYNV